mmetsp:Transcript_63699/g.151868  ORF Transcript_63699/g.151868 Transcript_63699/m.151868 type:complete len:240 (+) Transcript_63699:53-772(+)
MGKGGYGKGGGWGGGKDQGWGSPLIKPQFTKEPERPWRQSSAAPWDQSGSLNTGFGKSGGYGKSGGWDGGKSKGYGKNSGFDSGKGYGKSDGYGKGKSFDDYGKGKGKDKGKGKFKCAALNSDFWEKKLENENRTSVGEGDFTGTIQTYNTKFGWGLILPDDPDSLPEIIKAKLAEEHQAKIDAGKQVTADQLVYFRKPDVNHSDGFRLTDKGTPCTFKLYVDDKGAGAYDISPPKHDA